MTENVFIRSDLKRMPGYRASILREDSAPRHVRGVLEEARSSLKEKPVSQKGRIKNQNEAREPGSTGPRPRCALLILGLLSLAAAACVPPGIENAVLGDIRPPIVKNAGLENAREFVLEFDEPVQVRGEGFSAEPKDILASVKSSEDRVSISFEPQPTPGEVVTLAGNVQDMCGNTTHVQVQFKGYNDRPAALVLSEIQTAKNTSKKTPHRDYIELYAKTAGNLGGMSVQWASSTKAMRYDFSPCEVKAGEVVVLHLAPEGIADERNELGNNLGLSGGVDASPEGRDFWSDAGGLPDASGAVSVYQREGAPPIDGLFYAESSKTGALESPKLIALVQGLSDAGLWRLDAPPKWENAFLWKPSTTKPLLRSTMTTFGAEAWSVGESGTQSPGIVSR